MLEFVVVEVSIQILKGWLLNVDFEKIRDN